jgi:putative ABC transport system permease protein
LSCISIALVPALQTSRFDLLEGMKNSGNRSVSTRDDRTQRLFVVVQVALAFVLVVAAGLMARTFGNLTRSDSGFDPRHVSATTFYLAGTEFAERIPGQDLVAIKAPVEEFYTRLIHRVRSIPGVEAAGLVSRLPGAPMTTLLRGKFVGPVDLAELPFTVVPPKGVSISEWPTAKYNMIGGGFFESMRIPLVRGRYISDADVEDSPWVAVISETAARRYWQGEDPIGQNIAVSRVDNTDRSRRIVGIVADVRQYGPSAQPSPEIYTSFRQQRSIAPGDYAHRRVGMTVVARGPNPNAIAAAVYKSAADIDPQQPVYASYSMEELLGMAVAPWRFAAILLGAFAATGLLLASLGLYGIMARRVAERVRDISIRIALGAEPTVMMRKVISEGMQLTLAGLALGVIVSIPANQLLASKLFGVRPNDPAYIMITCGVLGIIALIALWFPARRAAHLDPVDSLREM